MTIIAIINNFSYFWLDKFSFLHILLFIFRISSGFFVMLLLSVFEYYYVSIAYLIIKLIVFNYKYNLDKSDLIKDKIYYRDKVEKYSPAVLSYIDNYAIGEHTLVATIIYLELKGLVTSEGNLQVTNLNPTDLDKNSSYVYNLIKFNNIDCFIEKDFNELVIEDCFNYKLIENKFNFFRNSNTKKLDSYTYIGAFIFFIMFPLTFIVNNDIVEDLIDHLYNIYFILVVFFIFFYNYKKDKGKSLGFFYKRSGSAIELNIKLDGLNRFLKDFSNLDDRTNEELILWEEYLIYSVLFNHNKNVINHYLDLIKINSNN